MTQHTIRQMDPVCKWNCKESWSIPRFRDPRNPEVIRVGDLTIIMRLYNCTSDVCSPLGSNFFNFVHPIALVHLNPFRAKHRGGFTYWPPRSRTASRSHSLARLYREISPHTYRPDVPEHITFWNVLLKMAQPVHRQELQNFWRVCGIVLIPNVI
jgi:hypothetical protein